MVYAVFVAKITPCGYDHDMRCLGQVEKELSDSTGDTPDRQEQMQNGFLFLHARCSRFESTQGSYSCLSVFLESTQGS